MGDGPGQLVLKDRATSAPGGRGMNYELRMRNAESKQSGIAKTTRGVDAAQRERRRSGVCRTSEGCREGRCRGLLSMRRDA